MSENTILTLYPVSRRLLKQEGACHCWRAPVLILRCWEQLSVPGTRGEADDELVPLLAVAGAQTSSHHCPRVLSAAASLRKLA